MKTDNSRKLFEKAKTLIPGGVNSPVRAFKAVGGNPIFMSHAKGAYLYDEDGNQYLDLINSWGPMILGHAQEAVEKAVVDALKSSPSFGAPGKREVEIAELIISMVPSIEKVRMVNSGTEATMSAIRVARGVTGRDQFIKFEGCYHGHGDSFLIAAGSGAVTMGTPDSPGVTVGTAKDTLLAKYNDLQGVKQLIAQNPKSIAAIIVEPVAGNMGLVLPEPGFLEGLRELCTKNDIILIFDEVMTGFRLAKGGAQERLGVIPDMTTLGKIIGGGLPVGAYGGKREIMDYVSPLGPVYQAGTLSGNPIAMAAGITLLNLLNEDNGIYRQLDNTTQSMTKGILENARQNNYPVSVNQIGSMYSLFFTPEKVVDFDTAKKSDLKRFAVYFQEMLANGIYLAPSQFESLFVSTAVKQNEIDEFLIKHQIAVAAAFK